MHVLLQHSLESSGADVTGVPQRLYKCIEQAHYISKQLFMQGKGPILLQSFSRSQFSGSGVSSSSTFSFGDSLRPPKETNMVILDDDGLLLVRHCLHVYRQSALAMHFT